jgi:hypothetical protein
MTISICLPVYRNLTCLRVAAKGLLRSFVAPTSLAEVLLHVQDPREGDAAIDCFSGLKDWPEPVQISVPSRGGTVENMSDIYNRLVKAATGDWILLMEQDTFVKCTLDAFTRHLEMMGFIAGGPVDTMHYSHLNARGHQLYGEHGRLSPQPGYFHSSLILLKREAIAEIEKPFSVPYGFKMHGNGILGGETYYGLREKIGQDKNKLAFFTQTHCNYGYAANITWGSMPLATHLYYSSTKNGYRDSGFISHEEHAWLEAEEKRFLKDYSDALS